MRSGDAAQQRSGRWNRALTFDEEGVTVEVGLHQAGGVTSARVEQDEIVVGVIGSTVASSISQQRETAAGHGGSRRPGKAGPVAEHPRAKGVTSRDEIGDFFLRGRQSAHVVRRGDLFVSKERTSQPPSFGMMK